ncbi:MULTISPECIES: phage major capsid protein [unclassified Campylobacter]|uniref:phage major capsid protein n=1 Tax=unclassified Campylobacter TaxID=2593542 RepID=UPI001473BD21|nr:MULTISPECIES: phage major capsid protein [unclassified Campylobacter]
MKFKSVAEAFNHYKTKTLKDIETRTNEIKQEINTNANLDMNEINIELDGLKEAKAHLTETRSKDEALKEIDKMNFETRSIKGDIFASDEYKQAFFKNLLNKPLNAIEQRALEAAQMELRSSGFASVGNTAAVIPTSTLNEVISKARTQGGVIAVARGFAMPSNIDIPVGTPTSKANWHTEGTEASEERPDIATVNFKAYEIIKLFSLSAAVSKMSIPAFESYISEELQSSVMACIADALINGTGSNQGKGVVSGISWVKNTNHFEFKKAGLAYADVVKVVAGLKRGYSSNAKWAMNNSTLYNLFYGLTDTTGRPIFIQDPKSENIGKILGFDVVVDDYMENDVVIFGNFDYLGYNLPSGIALESSTQSSFKSGKIDYRALAIADCKPIVDEAFIKLTRATA